MQHSTGLGRNLPLRYGNKYDINFGVKLYEMNYKKKAINYNIKNNQIFYISLGFCVQNMNKYNSNQSMNTSVKKLL